jgi:ABC-type nitrate/sulfonate/bicarbonate transport system substrate-binding protein
MKEEKKSKGCLAAAAIWIIILGSLAVAYKFLVHPYVAEKLRGQTGSESQYRHEVTIALDSFSGYAVLRSEAFGRELKVEGIKLKLNDDGADYAARIRAVRKGRAQLATFTIDSLVNSSADLGDFPATIVLVIDETHGADAIVAPRDGIKSIQDLDHADARIVLTPDSPSEFLARTVLAHFSLPNLPENPYVPADGAAEVYARLKAAPAGERRAYVLWEPFVSKAVDDGARVLLDSSKLKGYVVDVLVAQRKYLRDNPEVVTKVVAAYLRAAYSVDRRKDGMVDLVISDSKLAGAQRLDRRQAQQLVKGIRWKSTLENYAHFGLLTAGESKGSQHLEDMIANITGVLLKTGALPRDPLGGKTHTLFYDGTLRELKAAGFHPAKRLAVIDGVGPGISELGAIRTEGTLARLSDQQWDSLVPVGELKVKPIAFGRGTARINVQSERELARLAGLLKSLPAYYLLVVGHARAEGDPEANRKLAGSRADAALKYLVSQGLERNRVRARAAKPSGKGGGAQSVSFVVGQLPY